MSGLLPFAPDHHSIWSPLADQIHGAVWDRVGLAKVQEYVRQWAAEWNRQLEEAREQEAKEACEQGTPLYDPIPPSLPLPLDHRPRSLAEKWAGLAAIHDVFWLGDKINPWPEPVDEPDLKARTEWMKVGGGAFMALMTVAGRLTEDNEDFVSWWLKEVAPPQVASAAQPDAAAAAPAVGQPSKGGAVSLTPEAKTILEALANESGMTVTQEALADVTRLSLPTVRKNLDYLRENLLVRRPHGPRKGDAITDAGLAQVARR